METINSINGGGGKKRFWLRFWDRKRDSRVLKSVAAVIVVIASVIIVKDEIMWQFSDFSDEDYSADEIAEEEKDCNVFGIELHGDLTTYIMPSDSDAGYDQSASEDIMYLIETAEKDENIKAILLEIDSYGGQPVAGEEVSIALKNAQKPTAVLIRSAGVSAAYLAATGADKIFASKNSEVGSIGVTMSYLDYSQQNQKDGLTYNRLSSGKFKDAGDPDKTLTAQETELFMRDVNIMYQNFVNAVARNRNLDAKKVEILADGSTMLGEMALENGLIDQIGGFPEMEEHLKEKIGQDVEICW